MLSLRQAALGAGRRDCFVDNLFMTFGGDNLLFDENRVTDKAMHALRLAVFRAGGFLRPIGDFHVREIIYLQILFGNFLRRRFVREHFIAPQTFPMFLRALVVTGRALLFMARQYVLMKGRVALPLSAFVAACRKGAYRADDGTYK